MNLDILFEDAKTAEDKLPDMSPLDAFANDVQKRLSSRTRKRETIGMWVGAYDPDAVTLVINKLREKGYTVILDTRQQMSVTYCEHSN
jgi:hypothetical protein